jgi:diguanylate cyclase
MAVLTNPTDLARETLKLLAARRIAPTPENFTRYYHEIAGTRPPGNGADDRVAEAVRQAASAYPALTALSRIARALEDRDLTQVGATLVSLASGRDTGVRHDWGTLLREMIRQLEMRQTGASVARKREGLDRVLINFGSDAQLFEKLQALSRSWTEGGEGLGTPVETAASVLPAVPAESEGGAAGALAAQAENLRQLKELLAGALEFGVAARLERFPDLADEARLLAASAREPRNGELWARFGAQLRQFFFKIEVRGESDAELLDALLRLLGLLVNNIAELVEDDQWVSGQVAVIREVINHPMTTDRISEAERRFKEVIYKQSMLKHSLQDAKSSLKNLIGVFVKRLSEVTTSTADYHGKVETYAERLQVADDIDSLRSLVDELMGDTRSMQIDMTRSRDEIADAKRQAEAAEGRVRKLQAELEQVSEQVSQDQLTGALNRRGLDDAMQREISRAERRKVALSVAVLDLDNFKRLNDTYGHQAGDDALVHLTKVVKKTLRPTDIVARYGGEEFMILYSDTALPQALEITKRLQRELTKRYFLHNNERLLITFSAGVAQFKPGETQEAVFARADKAMYQAKLQGKNRVVAAEA